MAVFYAKVRNILYELANSNEIEIPRNIKMNKDILYARRLDACKGCGFLEAGTCGACGCYVELRAASKRGRCPYKKW